jgi:DNA-binding MarR family transcriptional regulator
VDVVAKATPITPREIRHPRQSKAAGNTAAAELLEFFYPVHYQLGTALEDVVRAGVLSRQQAAILWLIRSEGSAAYRMRRKDVEANIRRWFEVTSAAVSKSLRRMARPPLELIVITEDPRSGREKLLTLTPKGRKFLATTAAQATAFVAQLVEDAPPEILEHAVAYFRYVTDSFQRSIVTEHSRPSEVDA